MCLRPIDEHEPVEKWESMSVEDRAMVAYLEEEDAPAWAKDALKAVGEPVFKLTAVLDDGTPVPAVPVVLDRLRDMIDLLQTAVETVESAHPERDEQVIAEVLFHAARCMGSSADLLDRNVVSITFPA